MIVTFVIQSTILQYVEILNVKPNLLIIFVVFFALLRGSVEGGIIGLCAGLLMDLLAAKVFGVHSLLGLYIGVVIGYFNQQIFKESNIVAIFLVVICTFSYEVLYFFFSIFIWEESNLLFALINIIIPETIYNAFLAIPLYWFVVRINRWLEGTNKIHKRYW